jgi:hypothetical protein
MCILLLRQPTVACADFDEILRAEFGLVEIPMEQFPD